MKETIVNQLLRKGINVHAGEQLISGTGTDELDVKSSTSSREDGHLKCPNRSKINQRIIRFTYISLKIKQDLK